MVAHILTSDNIYFGHYVNPNVGKIVEKFLCGKGIKELAQETGLLEIAPLRTDSGRSPSLEGGQVRRLFPTPSTRGAWARRYRCTRLPELFQEYGREWVNFKNSRPGSDAYELARVKLEAMDDVLDEMMGWPRMDAICWLVDEFKKTYERITQEEPG